MAKRKRKSDDEAPKELVAAAPKLGGEVHYSFWGHYIIVDLGQREYVSVMYKDRKWIVTWPWGSAKRERFTLSNLTAVQDKIADLCTTPQPDLTKGT